MKLNSQPKSVTLPLQMLLPHEDLDSKTIEQEAENFENCVSSNARYATDGTELRFSVDKIARK